MANHLLSDYQSKNLILNILNAKNINKIKITF